MARRVSIDTAMRHCEVRGTASGTRIGHVDVPSKKPCVRWDKWYATNASPVSQVFASTLGMTGDEEKGAQTLLNCPALVEPALLNPPC
jgi:hypothetical protein